MHVNDGASHHHNHLHGTSVPPRHHAQCTCLRHDVSVHPAQVSYGMKCSSGSRATVRSVCSSRAGFGLCVWEGCWGMNESVLVLGLLDLMLMDILGTNGLDTVVVLLSGMFVSPKRFSSHYIPHSNAQKKSSFFFAHHFISISSSGKKGVFACVLRHGVKRSFPLCLL